MFVNFYNLAKQPFGETPDPRFIYQSKTHREAMASLAYGLSAGRGFLVLSALPGMGKTTLLFRLLEWLRGTSRAVFMFQTQCDSRDLLRFLLAELDIEAKRNDVIWMYSQLKKVLAAEAQAGRRLVLVIDEAQNLKPSVLESVRLLSDYENPNSKLIQIVLAGQPQLANKLARTELAQLRQRISIFSRLVPFSPAETNEYISHRLMVAGANGRKIFDPQARELIAYYARGIPRNINMLCFNAMSLGYALGKQEIDRSIIVEAARDFEMFPLAHGANPPDLTPEVDPELGEEKPAPEPRRAKSRPRAIESVAPPPVRAAAPEVTSTLDPPLFDEPPVAENPLGFEDPNLAAPAQIAEPTYAPKAMAAAAGAGFSSVPTVKAAPITRATPPAPIREKPPRVEAQVTEEAPVVERVTEPEPEHEDVAASEPEAEVTFLDDSALVESSPRWTSRFFSIFSRRRNGNGSESVLKKSRYWQNTFIIACVLTGGVLFGLSHFRRFISKTPTVSANGENSSKSEEESGAREAAVAPANAQIDTLAGNPTPKAEKNTPTQAVDVDNTSSTPNPSTSGASTKTSLPQGATTTQTKNTSDTSSSDFFPNPNQIALPAMIPESGLMLHADIGVRAPRLLSKATLIYPLLAVQHGIQGQVVVDTIIDTTGRPTNPKAIAGPPELRRAAVECVSAWQYQPGSQDYKPVPVEMVVPIDFTIPNQVSSVGAVTK
jgi:TonB family protein